MSAQECFQQTVLRTEATAQTKIRHLVPWALTMSSQALPCLGDRAGTPTLLPSSPMLASEGPGAHASSPLSSPPSPCPVPVVPGVWRARLWRPIQPDPSRPSSARHCFVHPSVLPLGPAWLPGLSTSSQDFGRIPRAIFRVPPPSLGRPEHKHLLHKLNPSLHSLAIY